MTISPKKNRLWTQRAPCEVEGAKDSCQIMYVEANVELQCREDGMGEEKDCNAAADEQEMELLEFSARRWEGREEERMMMMVMGC